MAAKYTTQLCAFKFNNIPGWHIAECGPETKIPLREFSKFGAKSTTVEKIGERSYQQKPDLTDFRFCDYSVKIAEQTGWQFLTLDGKWYPPDEVYLPPDSHPAYVESVTFMFDGLPSGTRLLKMVGGQGSPSTSPVLAVDGYYIDPEPDPITQWIIEVGKGQQGWVEIEHALHNQYLIAHSLSETEIRHGKFTGLPRKNNTAADFARIILISRGIWHEGYCNIDFDLIIKRDKLVNAYLDAKNQIDLK